MKAVIERERDRRWEAPRGMGLAFLVGLTLALLGARSTLAQAELPSFGPHTDFAAGGAPAAIVAADFDGDRVIDLATANDFSDDVSVLLGEGEGKFSPGIRYALGSAANGPVAMAAGDIDGDGITDLTVTTQLAGAVAFLRGHGDGGFADARGSSTGGTPAGLTIRDFDGDGRLDAIVAKPFEGAVTLLRGDGVGGFVTAGTWPVAGAAWTVAGGDLDADGHEDLVVGLHAETDGLGILRGDGEGGFAAARTIDLGKFFNPIALLVGDLNRDGRLDLAVANEGDDSVSIVLGDGDGQFGAPRQYDVSAMPRGLAAGDFNGDGWPDLVTAGRLFNQASVITGRGDGGFESAIGQATHAAPVAVVVADFDGDRLADLATANQESNDVSVLLNESPVAPACVGDCDGDGEVTVDELVRGVNQALQGTEADSCRAFDANGDGVVTIDELLQAVNAALSGCG